MDKKKEVLLSVVVPVFNRENIVGATLKSIEHQSYRPFEIIVVDNGSADGTLRTINEWAASVRENGLEIVVTSCPTPGAAAARNHGLSLARAPWVLFFDSDDVMHPSHLINVAGAIGEHPEADIIGWDTTHVATDGSRRHGRFFGTDMQRNNLFHGAMATQRWCARTAMVRAVGGWDEGVGYWDDIELGARMLATDPNIEYIGMGAVTVHESTDSITGSPDADPARVEPALTRIEKTIGPKGHGWCRLKRVIEYALCSRAGSPLGRRRMQELNADTRLWAAYHYTRLGGRGIYSILKFLV